MIKIKPLNRGKLPAMFCMLFLIVNSFFSHNIHAQSRTYVETGSVFIDSILLGSYPQEISDLPGWSIGEFPEWAEASIVTEIIEKETDFDNIINYYLNISGTPEDYNLGEYLITANLINPWTGDIIEVIETIFEVIESENCVCPMIYSPVCGNDGKTYGNACEASCEGVEIIADGACETESCICTKEYIPVCGVDGNTYGNACEASCKGVDIITEGACETETCICLDYYEPVCGDDGKTYGNACEASCKGVDIITDGACETESCLCTKEYNPVCGADKNTYDNACEADCKGIDIISEGACDINSTGCQVEDKFYEINESFNIDCNSCFCSEGPDGLGHVACTEMACIDGCYDDEKNHYQEGDSWNKDLCTTCFCENSEIICASMACAQPYCDNPIYSDDSCCPSCPDEEGCYDDTETYHSNGSEWDLDDCTFCSCEQGEVYCAAIDCLPANCDNPIYTDGECCPTCPDEEGCTDPNATNYDEYVNRDNGSCEYECTNVVCCLAMTASCMACSECMSVEEFCELNPTTPGCPSYGCTDPNAQNYNQNAGIDDESCSYIVETNNTYETNWAFEVTGINHSLLLPDTLTSELPNGATLEVGDKVGVFFNRNEERVCAGFTTWGGATTMIPAQGNDTTTISKDGFYKNEVFQWIIWDASENKMIEAEVINTDSSSLKFTPNGISSINSIVAITSIQNQVIELKSGWNMFSTYINKDNMKIIDVFHECQNDVIIAKDNSGEAFIPEWNYFGIVNMVPGYAYKTKMKADNSLHIQGQYSNPENHPITLSNGWNMIGYLKTEEASTIDVFADVDDLVIVKDNLGMAYLPNFDYNGIEMMRPGQGYQVKVLSEQILRYTSKKYEYKRAPVKLNTKLKYFNHPTNTGSNMSLAIPEHAWEDKPKEFDELAVLDSNGLLVGAMPYQGGNIVMPIYGNDELSPTKDGLYKNEDFKLVLWSAKSQLKTNINVEWEKPSSGFQKDHIAYASRLETSEKIDGLHTLRLFPNPTNHKTEVQAFLAADGELKISIFSLIGKLIYQSNKSHQKGPIHHVLDIEHLPAGSYIPSS
jgi:hypothetical protein